MSTTIADDSIRDTNQHNYTFDAGKYGEKILIHVVNDLDAEVTVNFVGTRDEDDFSDGEQVTSITVSADSSTYETMTDPWEEFRIEVTATTTPSADNFRAYLMSQGQ